MTSTKILGSAIGASLLFGYEPMAEAAPYGHAAERGRNVGLKTAPHPSGHSVPPPPYCVVP
jgi:hypothetical protein